MKVVFNVKLRNVFRVICMEEADLGNQQQFLEKVVEQFAIIAPEGIDCELFNSKRAPIEFEILPILIQQHKNDQNFFVEIQIDGHNLFINQTENLENFLRNHHCESILFEEKRNKCLSEEATEFLVEHLRDFIYHEYSFNPSPNDLVQVCEGAVELFPSLASENGNKIDILYDRRNRSGLLYEKLRYQKRKRDTKKRNRQLTTPKTNEILDEHEIDELIEYFESCVLERDKKNVLERMEKSAMVRKESYRTSRKMFDKCFHLYRVDIDLILADFKFMFPTVDEKALFDKWSTIEKKPFEIYKTALDLRVNEYYQNEMVYSMLTFLKLFSTHKYKFERSVRALVVICEDTNIDPQNLIDQKSDYPHIISVYSKEKKESQFYIAVSKVLMNIPNEYNFLQVIDVFFKLHFLFAVPFEPSLVQFIGVFEHYVYKMESDTNLTPATKKKAKAIFSLDVHNVSASD